MSFSSITAVIPTACDKTPEHHWSLGDAVNWPLTWLPNCNYSVTSGNQCISIIWTVTDEEKGGRKMPFAQTKCNHKRVSEGVEVKVIPFWPWNPVANSQKDRQATKRWGNQRLFDLRSRGEEECVAIRRVYDNMVQRRWNLTMTVYIGRKSQVVGSRVRRVQSERRRIMRMMLSSKFSSQGEGLTL